MYVGITVSRFGQRRPLNALKVDGYLFHCPQTSGGWISFKVLDLDRCERLTATGSVRAVDDRLRENEMKQKREECGLCRKEV